jgi:hypothetical protein
VLAARWAAAWFEKSLHRPLLAPLAGAVSASVVERFVAVVAAVVAAIVLVPADSFALLVDSSPPQAASRSAPAATKPASEGALILSEKRVKTAPTLCQSVYCGVGGSLRVA